MSQDRVLASGDGELPARADVVVVGAGITGASVAHQLAHRGVSVLVIEQAPRSGAGATGASGGMVRAYDQDRVVAGLALPSLAVYRDPTRWASGRSPLHAVGAVTVADPDRAPAFHEAAERINGELGTSAHLVADRAEVCGIGLAGGVALVEPEAGWVSPTEVTEDWLLQARTAGAVVRHGVRVLGVAGRGGRPVVVTDAGEVSAGAVIAAVGPWAADPVPGLRPAAPVRSRSIQVTILERRPPAPEHATFVDLRTGLYAKPVGRDRTLVGMPHLVWDSPVDAEPDPAHAHATVSALTAHFPWLGSARQLRTVRAADAYGGPAAEGRATSLLEPTGMPHTWSVRGWDGGGVKTAPEAGRRIAAACLADALPELA
ncbi:NAD(P)/FAD-dependent oxidoreductase [Streptacidiphilus jiangxiensis]|uniref:Glycine/D-amino acid oxidase n=1 Tax=Streptacidiphilus jiangxiensis TaxID=235985 RepID=A0A1H7KYV3_STRJI|nr:FAD-dependent oxidoreductase [Streptacidiphilus jiangxiensis]SEK91285.1 Glycine/D-amino acid oxidase [Streptacidiphilus jiangxiensis]